MDSKNIFVWSPFTSKIGTTNNVINSSYSLIKFSKLKNFNIKLMSLANGTIFPQKLKKKILKLSN